MPESQAPVQCPFASQVSRTLPAQLLCPGAQTPWHAPATQVWLTQGTAVPQLPLLPHVSTALPEHCVALGAQTPPHPPTLPL